MCSYKCRLLFNRKKLSWESFIHILSYFIKVLKGKSVMQVMQAMQVMQVMQAMQVMQVLQVMQAMEFLQAMQVMHRPMEMDCNSTSLPQIWPNPTLTQPLTIPKPIQTSPNPNL